MAEEARLCLYRRDMELSRRRMYGFEEEDAMAMLRSGRSMYHHHHHDDDDDDDDEVEIGGRGTMAKCLQCGERFKHKDFLNLYGATTEHLCDDCSHEQARSKNVVAMDKEKVVVTRPVPDAAMDAAIVARENQEIARENQEVARENQEIARQSQEVARQNQEVARQNAEQARGNAEAAREYAELAQKYAEAARAYIESAQKYAEAAQQNAEAAQQNAEMTQRNVEIARKNETTARVTMAFAVMIPLVMGVSLGYVTLRSFCI